MISFTSNKTGFFNGSYMPVDDIKIPVDNLAVNRSYGAFDFFGVKNRKPFYGDRHFKRFLNTIRLMNLSIGYDEYSLSQIVNILIDKNNMSDFYIKLFALPTDPDYKAGNACSLIIMPADAPVYDPALYQEGAILISKEYSRFLPEAKSTNYISMVYWYDEMMQNSATDVLYKSQNIIKETSRGNIFCVKNNEVFTPGKDILSGVTRSVVIELLNNHQIKAIKREITYDELISSDEVFLSSTTKKIMPIVKIDKNQIGNGIPGPLTIKLTNWFKTLQEAW